jgi:hypothetical protein
VAGDLIPPPSPAGRPAPDPGHAGAFEPVPEPPRATAPAEPDPGPSPFRTRFGFVSGALLGCAIAAGVLLLALLTAGTPEDRDGLARDWSTWKPTSSDSFSGATQIAKHVEKTYRNEKHKQLATVGNGPIAIQGIPLSVAIPSGDKVEVLDGTGIQYTLGGRGEQGRLTDSKPGTARHRLLRREALELALYSFRYLPEVTMVVTLLPPATSKEERIGRAKAKAAKKDAEPQRQAMFYRPGDLKPQLQVPLKFTIAPTPPEIGRFAGEEARRVDSLTMSNLFQWARAQGQDGRAYLVLERPS